MGSPVRSSIVLRPRARCGRSLTQCGATRRQDLRELFQGLLRARARAPKPLAASPRGGSPPPGPGPSARRVGPPEAIILARLFTPVCSSRGVGSASSAALSPSSAGSSLFLLAHLPASRARPWEKPRPRTNYTEAPSRPARAPWGCSRLSDMGVPARRGAGDGHT